MKKLINILFSVLKYPLLLAAFSLTLFIILRMNMRLEKGFSDSVFIFVPYGMLLRLYVLNIVLDRKSVTDNLMYNFTSVLVFLTNIIVCLRAMLDTNMLFNEIQKMGINFNYFNDYLAFNKIALYGLIIANIIFMFVPNELEKEEKIAKKITNKDVKAKKI